MQITEWIRFIGDMTTIASEIADAITSNDIERAQQILPPVALTAVARSAAEVRAAKKFGPRATSMLLPPAPAPAPGDGTPST